jgi:hypothetical protein
MLIIIRSLPSAQDPRIVIACIRACVWADVEGRPFCMLHGTVPASANAQR